MPQTEEKTFNIDEALAELETINTRLAGQNISLTDSMELYRKGTLLAAECLKHLEGVEKELQIINE